MRTPALALFSAAAIVLAACGAPKTATDPVRPVVTQRVTPGASASRDVYSGELRARYETDLAFRISGKMIARLVHREHPVAPFLVAIAHASEADARDSNSGLP